MKTLGDVGSWFHDGGSGVGPLHKQSRFSRCPHAIHEDEILSYMRNLGGGRKRKRQRMQRAGHGSELHGIGDDGDGAMRGRYSAACEVLELKLTGSVWVGRVAFCFQVHGYVRKHKGC